MKEIKIGLVIKRMLWKLRKNLKEISRETGIPYSTLHAWMLNTQPKDVLKVQRLADYFNVSLHELLFDSPDVHQALAAPDIPGARTADVFNGRFEVIVKRLE
jgi:Helix-turn-helix